MDVATAASYEICIVTKLTKLLLQFVLTIFKSSNVIIETGEMKKEYRTYYANKSGDLVFIVSMVLVLCIQMTRVVCLI